MSSFPKWLHKGWTASDQAPNCFVPGESKLAQTVEEAKALEAKGFTEAPPKAAAPAPVAPPKADGKEKDGK